MAHAKDNGHFGTAARYFAAGFLAALVVGILAFLSPDRFFKGSTLAPRGVRLVHDRYEIALFYDRGDWIATGDLPYSEASLQEYPPLGALYIAAPRFFTDDKVVFEAFSLARSAVCFGLLFALTAVLLGRFGRSRLRLLFFFLPAFLYFSLWRFDTFPALLSSLAVLAVASGRYGGAVIALWAGIAAKVYPVFFVIPFGLQLERSNEPKAYASAVRGGLLVFALSAAFLLAARVLGTSPLAAILSLHSNRGTELGSIRELALRGLAVAGAGRQAARAIIGIVFMLLQFGAALPLLWRVKVEGKEGFVRASLYLLIPFITFGWFFSQQWIIWLAPLALLVAGAAEMTLLVLLDLLLFLQFPVLYDADLHGAAFDVVTFLRTVVLVALWVMNARALSAPVAQRARKQA
ncbi:MAG: hypothetical protein RL272_188 [Candidatus Parcubacteria bacterium]|jgi:hypothetical protein